MTQALFPAALLFAAVYLFMPQGRATIARAIVKTVPVTLFAMIAAAVGTPWLLVAALILCALGDLLLAFARPATDDHDSADPAFLAGLVAFLTGHIAYIALFLTLSGPSVSGLSLIIALAIVATALIMARLLWRQAGALRWPVMAYVAAIATMGLASLATGSWLLVAGAALFVMSDAILGTEKFIVAPHDRRKRAVTGPAIWVLYIAAQAVIMSAFI
ncbi:MAG: lysoplasmalogenase [Roseitalea sp.]|jgi:uncharacterized membrane protein YhhN|nr:lysoplasmalogenase [Roseitalea sp.]MBO6720938.1 lysoplasmalogenase [Roseitalea sp.]MBO6743243.1 lysoplasmalogenase [Roseitalea sp.]